MKKRISVFIHNFKKIDFKSGAGSIMIYIAILWLIGLAGILFIEYAHAFSYGARTQVISDIVADGACLAGDTGWGLDTKKASSAAKKLTNLNNADDKYMGSTKKKNKTKVNTSISCVALDKNNKVTKSTKAEDLNAVVATGLLSGKTLTTAQSLLKDASATTKLMYSGGNRIVIEAFKHSWQYQQMTGKPCQTKYVWGGGHGGNNQEWKTQADCSGFVSGVFRECGFNFPSTTTMGMENMGQLVGTGSGASAYANARPGDIILFFRGPIVSGGSSHVGIFAGRSRNGTPMMIDCGGGGPQTLVPTGGPSVGVTLSPAECSNGIMVRRIVNYQAKIAKTGPEDLGGVSKNMLILIQGFKAAGYNNPNQYCGVAGNFLWESGGGASGSPNPYAREGLSQAANESYAKRIQEGKVSKMEFCLEGMDRYGWRSEGFGIAQWTTVNVANWQADRKAKLWDFATKMGTNVTNIYAQVAFALWEISPQGTHSGVGYALKSSNNLYTSTKIWLEDFEGINDGTLPMRFSYAQMTKGRTS